MVGVQRPVQLFSPLHSGEAGGNTQRRNHWNASNTLRCRTSFSPKHILVPHHSPFNRQLRRTGQHDVKAVHINLGKLCQGGDNWEMVMVMILDNFDEFDNHWNRITDDSFHQGDPSSDEADWRAVTPDSREYFLMKDGLGMMDRWWLHGRLYGRWSKSINFRSEEWTHRSDIWRTLFGGWIRNHKAILYQIGPALETCDVHYR